MNRLCQVVVLGLLAVLPQLGSADLWAAEPLGQGSQAGPCCFTNPRVNGVCQVQPTGDETCASILAYLNNPNSVGKTYCGTTQVRGGWTQVDCTQASSRSPSAPAGDATDACHLPVDGAL